MRTQGPHDTHPRILARRDPPNDGLENDSPDLSIYLDYLHRGCGITDDTFRAWRRTLTPDDLAAPNVVGFSGFVEQCIADRAERRAEGEKPAL